MKLRTLVLPALLGFAACGGGAWWLLHREAPVSFRTSPLTTTDVRKLVTATGALRAEVMVDVGTQVSGLIAELLADFNQPVKRGDLLAKLDTALLEADVASARARRAEADATARRKRLEFDRVKALRAQDAATDQEMEVAKADADVAAAQLQSADVTLKRAVRNLDYATIRSPIDGIVVKRAVEVGQTVNAGFSAPTLFTLAGDLSRMQILVRVDESDIGQLAEGGSVEFTVQSFPERTFTGTVRQVRLESVLDQSVVTYTVVVDVKNDDKVLLPGMTATVSFVVAEAKGVTCAPNAALRYRPDDTVAIAAPATPEGKAEGGKGEGRNGGKGRGKGPSTLYVVDGVGLRGITVKTGIRGTECTEVTGEGLSDGLEVVIGMERGETAGGSPLSAQGSSGGRRPGGF